MDSIKELPNELQNEASTGLAILNGLERNSSKESCFIVKPNDWLSIVCNALCAARRLLRDMILGPAIVMLNTVVKRALKGYLAFRDLEIR